ncbi:MAG: N-acetylmuramoyl-L-alanine amidase [Solirubrobacterales bacterium]
MRISGRGGHSQDVRGAVGIVDEVSVNRVITPRVFEYLKIAGCEVYDVTPEKSGTSEADLSIPVNKANQWQADYFFSVHLNSSRGLGHGCEVIYKSHAGKEYAEQIVSKLAALGFINRGVKYDTRGLYEFNHCVMPNNIIECFFCDNAEDIKIYNKIGCSNIAKAIAEGIIGKEIVNTGIWLKGNDGFWYYYENGYKVKNTWRRDSKDWCYLNEKGEAIVNGWAQDSTKKWFFCGDDCRIIRSQWIEWKGKQYYFNEDGAWDGKEK